MLNEESAVAIPPSNNCSSNYALYTLQSSLGYGPPFRFPSKLDRGRSGAPTLCHGWSLAHGAGRKWARSDARLRMRERFSVAELAQTGLGGRVVCEERDLLYEEAPAAYKSIEAVVHDLVDAGLVSVVATFRPLLTYKTRKPRR